MDPFQAAASGASHRAWYLSAVLQDREIRKGKCVGAAVHEREDRLGCPWAICAGRGSETLGLYIRVAGVVQSNIEEAADVARLSVVWKEMPVAS